MNLAKKYSIAKLFSIFSTTLSPKIPVHLAHIIIRNTAMLGELLKKYETIFGK